MWRLLRAFRVAEAHVHTARPRESCESDALPMLEGHVRGQSCAVVVLSDVPLCAAAWQWSMGHCWRN